MMKIALLVLCLVASACARPEKPVDNLKSSSVTFPDDYLNYTEDEEVAQLAADKAPFADFCINYRQFLIGQLEKSTVGKIQRAALSTIFTTAKALLHQGKEVSVPAKQPKNLYMAIEAVSGSIGGDDAAKSFKYMSTSIPEVEALDILEVACRKAIKFANLSSGPLFDFNKSQVAAKHPELAHVSYQEVPCLSTQIVSKANEICKAAMLTQ